MRLLAIALLVLPCAGSMEAEASTSERHAILEPKRIPGLERPCSRAAPGPIDGYWNVREEDVRPAETLLPSLVVGLGRPSRPLSQFLRQYVGIIVEQRHLLYINLFPESDLEAGEAYREQIDKLRPERPLPPKDYWRKSFVSVCDGGEDYWGVIFDPENRAFLSPAFNGP